MKLVLQAFEPMPQPFQVSGDNGDTRRLAPMVRKPRLRLLPAAVETRLFHAL